MIGLGNGGRGRGEGVLTLQFEDWFRLGADPSAHSAVSVLLDCLLRSYSFSYVEKKRSERQRNRAGPPTLTQHAMSHYILDWKTSAVCIHEDRMATIGCELTAEVCDHEGN